MTFSALFAVLTAMGMATTTTAAVPRRTTTATYDVSYRPAHNVYCIRFFSDAYAADPRPAGPGDALSFARRLETTGNHHPRHGA